MGVLLNLGRTALYGSATLAGFGATLHLTQPAKFEGWVRRGDELRANARAKALALQATDPQLEASNALSGARSHVTESVRWQTVVVADMVQAQLDDTAEQLAAQAAQAAAQASSAAEEAAEAAGLNSVSRTEVHVLLPGGNSYEGTALSKVFSLATDCVPDGYGTMQFTSGDRYTGGFRDGAMHGRGRYETATGEEYLGEFVAGAKEGKGSMTDAAGRVVKEGRWSGGEFVGA